MVEEDGGGGCHTLGGWGARSSLEEEGRRSVWEEERRRSVLQRAKAHTHTSVLLNKQQQQQQQQHTPGGGGHALGGAGDTRLSDTASSHPRDAASSTSSFSHHSNGSDISGTSIDATDTPPGSLAAAETEQYLSFFDGVSERGSDAALPPQPHQGSLKSSWARLRGQVFKWCLRCLRLTGRALPDRRL